MIIKIVILLIVLLVFLVYKIYFSSYFKVRDVYMSLKSFLDVRDALVLKLVPEIKNEKMSKVIVNLIDERKENFKTSYNNSILADVRLNSELREFYKSVNEIKKNDVINSVFSKIINLEKDLKNIRIEYNKAVEKYNDNLIKHKFVCLKVIRMKPLDTYKVRESWYS